MTNDKLQMTNKSGKIQMKSSLVILSGLVFIVSMLLLSGCSRIVTERVPFGSEMTFDINFRGNMNIASNKYFIVISTNEAYQIPFTPYEFIEPGIPPVNPSDAEYLYNYYRTWTSYAIVDSGIIYLVKGPFNSTGEVYTRTQIGSITLVTNKLSFQFSLDRIFPVSLPDIIYFDFVSADGTRFLKDHLTPPAQYITTYQNTIVSGSDEASPTLDPSLDILNWTATIQ